MKRKGSAIIVSIVITSVLLSISLTTTSIAFKFLKISNVINRSQSAFLAADSAYECALFEDQVEGTFDVISSGQYPSVPTSWLDCGDNVSTNNEKNNSGLISPNPLGDSKEYSFYVHYSEGSCANVKVTKRSRYETENGERVYKGINTIITSVGRDSCPDGSIIRKVISDNI